MYVKRNPESKKKKNTQAIPCSNKNGIFPKENEECTVA
jgi:hypothetical protein